MDKKQKIEIKSENLLKAFGKNKAFSIEDAESILKEKKSTLKWTMHNLVNKSYLRRKSRGKYIFADEAGEVKPMLSSLAKNAIDIIQGSGFNFFISGLDILGIFMHHIPESYPVILFAENNSEESIIDILRESDINAVTEQTSNDYESLRSLPSVNEVVRIYSTKNFNAVNNYLASFERAFVDLYYEVTRINYPLPVQDLARIFLNMNNRIIINDKRMLYFAHWRKIKEEINLILNYKNINDSSLNFIKILNKQDAL